MTGSRIFQFVAHKILWLSQYAECLNKVKYSMHPQSVVIATLYFILALSSFMSAYCYQLATLQLYICEESGGY